MAIRKNKPSVTDGITGNVPVATTSSIAVLAT